MAQKKPDTSLKDPTRVLLVVYGKVYENNYEENECLESQFNFEIVNHKKGVIGTTPDRLDLKS